MNPIGTKSSVSRVGSPLPTHKNVKQLRIYIRYYIGQSWVAIFHIKPWLFAKEECDRKQKQTGEKKLRRSRAKPWASEEPFKINFFYILSSFTRLSKAYESNYIIWYLPSVLSMLWWSKAVKEKFWTKNRQNSKLG